MFENFKQWIEAVLGSKYGYSLGPWEDADKKAFICSIQNMGGSAIDVDDRRPKYRVLLVSPKSVTIKRQLAHEISADIERIIINALENEPPCGSAGIRVITEPSGVGYTTEGRAFISADFQITH